MLGTGTQADPYIIETLQDLQDMNLGLAAYYELGNDIDAAETATWNDNGDGTFAGFEPIGNETTHFKGSFDGKNYTISNLYINRPNTNEVGLFGYIEDKWEEPITVIQNATLKNINFTGRYNVGGLIATFENGKANSSEISLIQNCIVDGGTIASPEGSMSGGFICRTSRTHNNDYISITNCHAKNITFTNIKSSSQVGGFIGRISNGIYQISQCSSINNTIDYAKTIGGFCGDLSTGYDGTNISNCKVSSCILKSKDRGRTSGFISYISTGTVTGSPVTISNCYVNDSSFYTDYMFTGPEESGFIWRNDSADVIIKNCYTVFTPSESAEATNGFITYHNGGTIEDCYWDTDISGIMNDAALSGTTGLTTAQMKDPANFPNWDFTDIWANDGVTNGGYHYLQAFPQPVSIPFRYWNGSEWVTINEIRYWNGSEWAPVKSFKRWDGENWV